MKETIKIITVLTFVCVICAFFLALVQGLAEENIKLNAAKNIKNAISNLAPEYSTIEEVVLAEEIIYKLKDKQGMIIGYAFSAEGQGYQGKIKILAVADPYLSRLEGIEIVDSIETPGLGAKITEKPFSEQFKNLGFSALDQVQSITGATISSRAVVNILNKRILKLKKQIE